MASFTLTTDSDTFAGTSADDTVFGTSATLNAGDSLTGGGGTDVLALSGSGTFRVDQLAVFTGFASITLDNVTSGGATLYLGNQSIAVTGSGTGSEQVYLGSGAVTYQGSGVFDAVYSSSSSNWNAGNAIDGGSNGSVYLDWNGPSHDSYDLTANIFTHVSHLSTYVDGVTVTINSAAAGGVANFFGGGANDILVTSDATLDLSHSTVSGFTVSSNNATGTDFIVHDAGTAFQITGGPGADTITALGFAFTANQRTAIFATQSIETIVDTSGTYTAPPQDPHTFTLTTGTDTITGTSGDDTVYGTAATLNAGDSLTGGGGTDVLALSGSGTFHVDQLAVFTGFASITLSNITSAAATLYLGSQSIAVTGSGTGTEQVYLGSGAVTLQGGGGPNLVYSTSSSNWNAGNAIDGGSNGAVYLDWNNSSNDSYDLTTNTLSHINSLYGYGAGLTVTINSAVASGVANFHGEAANDILVTSDATLDLSHSTVSGFTVASTNATGTDFIVQDAGTAFQITGGPGADTITAQGFAFTDDQRSAIFASESIETIVDTSGTYALVEASGSTSLIRAGNDFVMDATGTATGAELKYSGAAWTAGEWGGWTPIAAEATASGYEVAFKIGTDTYTVWNTDAQGNITTDLIGSVSGSSLGLQALETSFHQDLNNDRVIGLSAGNTLIEASGSTNLIQTGSNYVLDKAGGDVGLLYDGAAFVAGQWGGWTPVGAEATATGYEVAFKLAGADLYTVWDTDTNGNVTLDPIGNVSGESPTLIALEKSFQQDLNGDGTIGNPAMPITVESFGSTSLVLNGNDYFLDPHGTSNGPMLKYDGAAWTDGEWGGWTPVAAEATAGGHEVAFNLSGTNEYTVWNTDANGNITSDTIGTVTANSATLEGLETSFHQDLNGDGIIGDPSVPYTIESAGSTSLTQLGHDFFLYANGTSNGPELKYSGAAWTNGVWGGWTPIGAEATAGGGYEVAFKLTGADLYTVWNTDADGNITSSPVASVSGSDASLQSIETSFNQDLNGDGVIGLPSHTSAAISHDSTAGSATAANNFNVTVATLPIIAPAAGNAVLAGTAASDTFVFNAHFGNDTVTGFQPGVDQVNLDHTLFADVADLLTHTSDNAAGSAVVGVGANQSITFDHVSTAVLQQHASDFHLV